MLGMNLLRQRGIGQLPHFAQTTGTVGDAALVFAGHRSHQTFEAMGLVKIDQALFIRGLHQHAIQ